MFFFSIGSAVFLHLLTPFSQPLFIYTFAPFGCVCCKEFSPTLPMTLKVTLIILSWVFILLLVWGCVNLPGP